MAASTPTTPRGVSSSGASSTSVTQTPLDAGATPTLRATDARGRIMARRARISSSHGSGSDSPPRGGSTRRRDAGGHSRPSRTGSRMLLRSGRRQTQSPITGIRRWPPPGTATPSRLSELSASRSGFTEHTRQTSSSLTISPIIFHPFQEFERTLERRRGYRITSRRTRRRGSSRHVIEPHELNPSELMIQGESRLQRSDG